MVLDFLSNTSERRTKVANCYIREIFNIFSSSCSIGESDFQLSEDDLWWRLLREDHLLLGGLQERLRRSQVTINPFSLGQGKTTYMFSVMLR